MRLCWAELYGFAEATTCSASHRGTFWRVGTGVLKAVRHGQGRLFPEDFHAKEWSRAVLHDLVNTAHEDDGRFVLPVDDLRKCGRRHRRPPVSRNRPGQQGLLAQWKSAAPR